MFRFDHPIFTKRLHACRVFYFPRCVQAVETVAAQKHAARQIEWLASRLPKRCPVEEMTSFEKHEAVRWTCCFGLFLTLLEERQLLTHEQILGGQPCTAAEERSTGTQAVRNGDLQGNNGCRDLPGYALHLAIV
jgi:hypothetical protein